MLGVLPKFYKFEVVHGTRLGRACFATKPIVKGEIICKMNGPRISLKDFCDKYEWNDCGPLQIGKEEFIDLIEPYICFNHSCDPNAGIRNNGILFALKDIKPKTEIFYDYSTTVDDNIWHMECKCNSKICRKLIGDYQTIPHDRKEYYRKNGALTQYLLGTYY